VTELRTARPIRVGLLWHSPNSGNLGVGALTVANLALARQVAAELGLEPQFTIVGMQDADARYVTEGEAGLFSVNGRSLLSPSGCWRVLGAKDCILDIGAGDSFADIYGPKRFGFLWLTKMIAYARGVPLALSPQTIGPFTKTPYVQLARRALERARAVVARDETSLKFLRKLAPRARGVLSVDVAFAMPYEDRSSERGAAGKLRVGVNVSGLLLGEAQSGRNRFGLEADYGELMRRFIGGLSERSDIELHLLTHANGKASGADDDGWAADELAREFPDAIRVPDFESPQAAKSYISSLDFLTAGRMHACIAAYSAGTPVVPVAYSRKFAGLFGMLDYAWMVPVTGMSTDRALAFLNEALERRAELAVAATQGMSRVDGLLEAYRRELRTLFAEAAP
jgi:colanic acid/amylovoran biosynthesis protein